MTRPMRVLVACEFSGTVREAFLGRGHDAWSCDLLPDEWGSNRHIKGDVREILNDGWDLLMVAHPPCTRLCNSGVRWLSAPPKGKTVEQIMLELDEGAALFSDLWNAPSRQRADSQLPATGSDDPTLAIRPRRDKSYLSLAEESQAASAHQHC